MLISWASANRDEDEFACPDDVRPRPRVATGTWPSAPARTVAPARNLARMNLRIAVEELLVRLPDVRLAPGAEPIPYHSILNRSPVAVPITFTPGRRSSS